MFLEMLFQHFYKLAISIKQGKRNLAKFLWKYVFVSYLIFKNIVCKTYCCQNNKYFIFRYLLELQIDQKP